jgi:acetyltransferase
MSSYRFEQLFGPRSIALVGASPREKSIGRLILKNLRSGGFAGSIQLVNPDYREIEGCTAVKTVDALPDVPDMAVIASPPPTIPSAVAALAARGCAVGIIISSGLGHGPGSLAEATRLAAHAHGMRLVGPNCLGLLVPRAKLNTTFAARTPLDGDLALISQSGAIAASLLEWAAQRKIGFSAMVSVGDMVDVDFGDLLDYFAVDPHTRAILLYIEAIHDARKFMSAARAAACVKPIVVIKAGRHELGAKAARTHTGALAGSDAVYGAAFRRAGLLRVNDLDELFAAAETLGRLKPFPGRRLAILTNGGGIGVLAVDRLVDLGGTLADISPQTLSQLDAVMPPTWSRANPIDMGGDSDAHRYEAAVDALLSDRDNDAVLVMYVPTALTSPVDAARSIAGVAQRRKMHAGRLEPMLAVWVGEDPAAADIFNAAGIPHYATESDAIAGFMHLVRYRDALDALMKTPPSVPSGAAPDIASARAIVSQATADGRNWLDPIEASKLLSIYAIPVTPAALARNADEAAAAAAPLLANGSTIVVKILSPDIVHKSDVGGVRLDLASAAAVRQAAAEILENARAAKPEARIAGVTLHPMIVRPKARELIAGIADDPTFGPIIVFGHGGTAVEIINDKALALPPIDLNLAHDLIARTRVSRILEAYRNVPAVDKDAIALLLVRLSQMSADLPEIREVDLNPIVADENGLIVLDPRIAVAPMPATPQPRRIHPRFAVRPYPKEWERHYTLRDGMNLLVRPVRPEDEPLYWVFFPLVTDEDIRLRFFAPIKELSHAFIARLIQIDYARAMAFIAIDQATGRMVGVARLHASSNYESGEFAILIRSDLKGRGIGWQLMQLILEYARAEGLRVIEGQVLRGNTTMLSMCRKLGFDVGPDPKDRDVFLIKLPLVPPKTS